VGAARAFVAIALGAMVLAGALASLARAEDREPAGAPTPEAMASARASGAESVSVLYGPSFAHLMSDRIGPEFTRATGVRFDGQPQASLAEMRLTTASGAPADVAIVTDPELLGEKATAAQAPYYVVFAADAMVVAYRGDSTYAKAIASGMPWFDALRAGGVRFGRLDPDLHPLGMRAIFVLQLARRYYESGDLAAQLLRPDQIVPATDLVPRLQRGALDAALLYRSQAVEAGLSLLDLPVEINLSDPGRRGVYDEASLEVHGNLQRGAPLVVAAVPLAPAPHPAVALRFVDFLTSGRGRRIFEDSGFVTLPGFPLRRAWGQAP